MQSLLTNVMRRVLPAHYMPGGSTKHKHYKDFGWPETLTFNDYHRMYQRNGLATAAVDKTVAKTWETHPTLWESDTPTESPLEADIRRRFAELRIWQSFMNLDRKAMVGKYAGAIILLADGLKLEDPVTRVPGNLQGLAGIVPAWEGQLAVAEWDEVQTSPRYGQPLFYQFNEHAVDGDQGKARQFRVHYERVLVWSEDGTINGRSTLEPGYNDLLDAEKVKGAGGEGFWKTSRGAPIITAPDGLSMADVMKGIGGTTPAEALDKINEQIANYQTGFDEGLLLGGLNAVPMTITLPQPEQFFNVPVQSFAASMQIPVRTLIGNQTGERSSTEDAREWAQVNMARRNNLCVPALHDFIGRLVRWGILPPKDWTIGWESLLDATPDQLLDRAAKMAEINAKGEPTFLVDEMREVAGYKPAGAELDEQGGEDTEIEDDEARTR